MGLIHELDAELINKIAAGEVIESAHSVLKELLENSLDAGATEIGIETSSGGLDKILISDNGKGISEEDIELAVRRHATSKILNLQDLEKVTTFGFRGEALASIASISKMEITTGQSGDQPAVEAIFEGGQIIKKNYAQARKGTVIEVKELFFNVPVRRKFLKSEKSEDKKIRDRFTVSALSAPSVRFRFVQNGKEIYRLKEESLKDRILSLFGENLENHLLETGLERRGIKAYGFITDPEFYRSNRMGQFTFINGRPVEIKNSSFLLKKCYDELLPPGAHPWCFLFFELDPTRIDVNVHPTKKEIRFLDEEGFISFFLELVNSVLRSKTPVGFLELKKRFFKEEKLEQTKTSPSLNFQYTENINTNKDNVFQSLYTETRTQEPFDLTEVGAGTRLELLTDRPVQSREFIPKKHHGLIFETFILAEAEDGLYIIDQHTAHERIRYEEVLRQMKRKNSERQSLLVPIRLDLSIQDAEEILEKKEDYEKVGIVLDSLGGSTIVIREVPTFLEPGKEKETVLDFLNRTKSTNFLEKEFYDELAKCVACRSAVKKGDHVSDVILGELLNRLSYCENPSRCPHGRPTLVKLTRDDLEKMFHRK